LLHEQGIEIRAATFKMPGTQDYEYARRFAAELGIALEEVPYSLEPVALTTGTTTATLLLAAARPFLPGRVFSSDGGGEIFGFLLLPPEVMAMFGRNEVPKAIRTYLKGHGLPLKLFRGRWRKTVQERPYQAMQAALLEFSHLPAEKAMHWFVLAEDLRRHLHEFFELAPRFGYDLVIPFYDRRVLRSVWRLAPPLDPFLNYRLYHEVMKRMPEACLRVPWQSYPGRPPCPVPDDGPPLKNQWEYMRELQKERSRLYLSAMLSRFLQFGIPFAYIQPVSVLAAAVLQTLRRGDYGYYFRTAAALAEAAGKASRFKRKTHERPC
jgi:hypothetical protein